MAKLTRTGTTNPTHHANRRAGGAAVTSHTAASFPGGAANYIGRGGPPLSFRSTAARTMMCWAKPTAISTTSQSLMFAGLSADSVDLGVVEVGGADEVYFASGSARYASDGSGIGDGEWHHFAVTVADGGSVSDAKFYVDGVLQSAQAVSGDAQVNVGVSVTHAGLAWSAFSFAGLMQDWRLYDTDLSAADVLTAASGGVISTDVLQWQRMDDAVDLGEDATGNFDSVVNGTVTDATVLDSDVSPVPETIYAP